MIVVVSQRSLSWQRSIPYQHDFFGEEAFVMHLNRACIVWLEILYVLHNGATCNCKGRAANDLKQEEAVVTSEAFMFCSFTASVLGKRSGFRKDIWICNTCIHMIITTVDRSILPDTCTYLQVTVLIYRLTCHLPFTGQSRL